MNHALHMRRRSASDWLAPIIADYAPLAAYVADRGLFSDAGTTAATAHDTLIYQRNDKAGANHATQSTSTNRPKLKLNAINSRSAIDFDGVDNYMTLGSEMSLANMTVISAFMPRGAAALALLASSSDVDFTIYFPNDSTVQSYNGAVAQSTAVFPTSYWHLATITKSGATYAYRRNGTACTADATAGAGDAKVGRFGNRSALDVYYNGQEAVTLIWDRVLSGAEIAAVETIINNELEIYGPNSYAVNNANVFWSPGNVYVDGSTAAKMVTQGAYVRIKFTGTFARLMIDTSAFTIASADDYPIFHYQVDGGAFQQRKIVAADQYIVIGSHLSNSSHEVFGQFLSQTYPLEVWSPPSSAIRVTAIQTNAASLAAPTLRTNRALFFGDSITAGMRNVLANDTPEANDAYQSWVTEVADYFDCEYGHIGIGGHSWDSGTYGAASLETSYGLHYAGVSRLSGGLFDPEPDYVFINEGTNGVASQAVIVSTIEAIRAAAGATCWIAVIIPFNQSEVTDITAAFATYQAAHPSDTKTKLINLGALGLDTTDGLHPSVAGHAAAAAALIPALVAAFV